VIGLSINAKILTKKLRNVESDTDPSLLAHVPHALTQRVSTHNTRQKSRLG